jgi:hypothetical protein
MMAMVNYLAEIEYAASSLFPVIWEERNRLQKLEAELDSLTRRVKDNYLRAEFLATNSEDPDDVAMAAGVYWENYFGDDKDRYHKDKHREELVDQVATHAFSVDSLAGSLLQYAKQGISLSHGNLSACPNGRAIGTQFLKNVIWQGRNQAIHWEEHKPHLAVQQCFNKLAVDVNPRFSQYTTRNMAGDVVELLDWTDFAKFSADLLSLV